MTQHIESAEKGKPFRDNRALALALAHAGYAVFPCRPDKVPLVRWRHESDSDPAYVAYLWDRYPNAPPALDIEKSGIVVLDGDRHGGPDGVAALRQLLQKHGTDARKSPVIKTPGGGIHFYLRQIDPPLTNCPGNLPAGIDIKGAGGCIMAPWAELCEGKMYQPLATCYDPLDRSNIPIAPKWLVDIVRPKREPLPPPPPPKDRTAYALAILNGECAAATVACNGTRQYELNRAAFKVGRKLIATGHIAIPEAERALLGAAETNGLIAADGLRRVRQTIASGLRAGMQKGR